MICEEAMALMSAKLDGALTPEQDAQLTAHLAACPDCANLMETLRGLDSQVAELREPAPQGLKKGVLYRIDQATGKAKPSRRGWFGPGTAIGAVAAVLVLLVGLGVVPLGDMKANSPAEGASQALDSNTTNNQQAYKPRSESADWSVNGNDGSTVMQYAGEYVTAVTRAPAEADPEVRRPNAPDELPTKAAENGLAPSPFVTEAEAAACAALGRGENAAVLLYTEFTPESLFSLLEAEEPRLYALVADLEPEPRDGLICYETDCATVLALQEWFLSRLPTDETVESEKASDNSAMKTQLEALDLGSTSLYRIISWDRSKRSVNWPADWAPDWAERMRDQENWRLFFPDEDYVPNGEKTAYLVFPDN